MTFGGSTPGIYPGPFSLAIPLWVGAMSTEDCFSHLWEKNGASEVMTLRLTYLCISHLGGTTKSAKE